VYAGLGRHPQTQLGGAALKDPLLVSGTDGDGTKLKNPGGGGANVQWVKVDGPKVAMDFNGNATRPISPGLRVKNSLSQPSSFSLATTRQRSSALCPPDVRVGAWVKPWAVFKPGVGVAYAWEPVLVRGGRKRERTQDTARDWVAASITLRRGVVGAKPDAFCYWLFEVLNLQPDDDLVDLYPGSGAVARAWERWRRRMTF